MDDEPPLIRPMVLADCARVSEIRVRGWQFAYEGLMPRSYLDTLSVERDTARRRARFIRGGGAVLNLVAERAGEVVGWSCHGPCRDGRLVSQDAELYALYLAAGHLGTGVGRALLQESLRRCAALGHDRVLLWVLRDNTRARRFYERAGFRPDGAQEPFEAGGVAVPEVRYVRELAGRPGPAPPG